jgi:hypothetical protein
VRHLEARPAVRASASFYDLRVLAKTLFWGSLGALAWTHVG